MNLVQDAWGEQVVKRGWTSWQIPSALHPSLSWVWLVILGGASRSGRSSLVDNRPMADGSRMIFLGFGKYARADKIYALEPLRGDERGGGRRTRVWVEGVPDPIVASRTERTILAEMGQEAAANVEIVDDALALARAGRRRRRAGTARPRRPPAARAAVARGDDVPGRRRQALLSDDPRLTDDVPPGLEGPGVRERFARLAIDLSPAARVAAVPLVLARAGGEGPRRRRRAGRAAVPDLPADRLDARRRGALVRRARPARDADAARRRARGRGRPPAAAPLDAGRDGGHRRRARRERRACRTPQEWACFVLAFFSASFFCLGIGGMRSITPRLVRAGAAHGGARAREHLELVRVGRRPGARRASSSARSGSRRRTRSTS